MNTCDKIQEMLSDYRTELVGRKKREELEAHVAGCEDCARELQLLDAVLAVVEENIPDSEPPAGLWNGVYNRITSPEPRRAGLFENVFGWMAKPARAAGVAVAALLIAAGIYMQIPQPQPMSPHVASRTSPADEYVQEHAMYTARVSSADQAAYLVMVSQAEADARK